MKLKNNSSSFLPSFLPPPLFHICTYFLRTLLRERERKGDICCSGAYEKCSARAGIFYEARWIFDGRFFLSDNEWRSRYKHFLLFAANDFVWILRGLSHEKFTSSLYALSLVLERNVFNKKVVLVNDLKLLFYEPVWEMNSYPRILQVLEVCLPTPQLFILWT